MGELINQWTSVSTSTKSTQATCDQNKSQNRQQKNGVLDRAQQITRRNQNHAKLPVIQAPIAPRKAGNRQDQIENRTNSTKTSKQCVKNRGESARDESAVSPVGRLMRSPPPPHSPEPDACTQPVDDASGSWGNGSMAQATAEAAAPSPEFQRRRRGEKGLTPTAQQMLATGSRTLAPTSSPAPGRRARPQPGSLPTKP